MSLIVLAGEPPFPRAMLALFSLVMFRQILLSVLFSLIYILPELLESLRLRQIPDNFFRFGRRTRGKTVLMVTFLFLVAISLAIWSPSLLPIGISPQYIAISAAAAIAFPSIVLSIFVQMRLVSIFDRCLDPLEREISAAAENARADKDEIDRIASLVEVRSELTKVSNLPWITVGLGILQIVVAGATIFAAVK